MNISDTVVENIRNQKEIAQKILKVMVIADPEAALAGGAVRDWRFNRQATDLDFYLRLPNHYSITLQKHFIEELGMIDVKEVTASDEKYKHMNNIVRVFAGDYKGIKCNVMVMQEKSWAWWYGFSNSLCKCHMNHRGECIYTKEFETSVSTQTVTVTAGYPLSHPHILKMMRKFPDFKFEEANTLSTVGDYY